MVIPPVLSAPATIALIRCPARVLLNDAVRLGSVLGIGHATCQLAAGHVGQHVWGNSAGLLAVWT
jgi:hypothetical protein